MEITKQPNSELRSVLIGYLDAQGLTQKLTEQEKNQFIEIARAFGLNPFKREIYCAKFGDEMSIIVGYEVYLKRAEASGKLQGWKVMTDGMGEDLRAIITIYRNDWKEPFVHEVYFEEYAQRTKDGRMTKFWATKPRTMLKKVAISQGMRLCFPVELGGMPYTAEEIITEDAIYTEITTQKDCSEAIKEIESCNTLEELKSVWVKHKSLQKEIDFINAKNNKKTELQNGNSNQ